MYPERSNISILDENVKLRTMVENLNGKVNHLSERIKSLKELNDLLRQTNDSLENKFNKPNKL